MPHFCLINEKIVLIFHLPVHNKNISKKLYTFWCNKKNLDFSTIDTAYSFVGVKSLMSPPFLLTGCTRKFE